MHTMLPAVMGRLSNFWKMGLSINHTSALNCRDWHRSLTSGPTTRTRIRHPLVESSQRLKTSSWWRLIWSRSLKVTLREFSNLIFWTPIISSLYKINYTKVTIKCPPFWYLFPHTCVPPSGASPACISDHSSPVPLSTRKVRLCLALRSCSRAVGTEKAVMCSCPSDLQGIYPHKLPSIVIKKSFIEVSYIIKHEL